MNSFAIYRELLNLPDLDILDLSLSDKEIIIFWCVKSDVTEYVCRKCGKLTSRVNQDHVRTIRDLEREAFYHILDNATSLEAAFERLIQWKIEVIKKGITEFDAFIKMLNSKQELVINYVTNYRSNAATEGLNNLIKSIRRTAFGMTNFQNLRWRVLAISD